MTTASTTTARQRIETPSGRIAYREQGTGPVALFVHGVLLNGHLWRHQLAELSDIRRCLAPDLLAHGDTEIMGSQDVSVTANATMLREFLDALGDRACGSGRQRQRRRHRAYFRCHLPAAGAHAHPDQLRRPRQLAAGAVHAVPGDGRRWRSAGGRLAAMLADKNAFRSPQAFGPAYEHPERVSDETIDAYLAPLLRTAERTRDLQRFLAAFDNAHTRAVEAGLAVVHGADAHRLGHRRHLLRRPLVEVAGRDHPGHDAAGRARGGTNLLSRRALGGVQLPAARPLDGLTKLSGRPLRPLVGAMWRADCTLRGRDWGDGRMSRPSR